MNLLMHNNGQYWRWIFLLLCALQLFPGAAQAAQNSLDVNLIGEIPASLSQHFDILEDATLTLSLADVQHAGVASKFRTQTHPTDALSFSYTRSAYWLRLKLNNPANHPVERILEINYARLSNVEFYQQTANGTYLSVKTGNAMPFSTRPFKNRHFVFPVTLPALSEQMIYMRFESAASLIVPARLWIPQAFHDYERDDYVSQSLYFGMAIAMVLFNLLLFIALRDFIYLMYVSFVVFISLSMASQNGLAKEYLWPETLSWSDTATSVGYGLAFVSLLLFMRRMLNTVEFVPKFDRYIKFAVGTHVALIFGFIFSLKTFIKPSALFFLATAILILVTAIYCSYKRQRSAFFFLAAFAMLVMGIIATVLTNYGLLPSNMLTMNSLQFGSALEMLLLALALADRFNTIKSEKEKAQKEALEAQKEALNAQKSLIEGLKTSEKLLEARVEERTAELRIAATAFDSHESTIVTDAEGEILKVNPAITETTGYTSEELVGKTTRLLKSGIHDDAFYDAMWGSLNKTGAWQGEIWNRRKNGEVYAKWMTITAVKGEDGVLTNYVATHQDITDRKVAEERIAELAFFDPLTHLPNRTLLRDRMKQVMTASDRSGNYSAVLFLDLDQFKTLNDTQGHANGDLLLLQVAQRLVTIVREGDTVARLGGDEFVVLLTNMNTNAEEAAKQSEVISKKILADFAKTFQLDDTDYLASTSIGATLFKGQETTIDELLKQAELAMYKSKASGRNTFHFFDQAMETVVVERVALETGLRKAIKEKQFLLHYQAQVSGEKSIVTGAEVLVRWKHPTRGMVSPAEFIPLAEETGIILPLGLWVLETACDQLSAWSAQPDMAHLNIAVNVSARQFRQADFVDQVLSVLKSTGANPQRLKLELTESLLVNNVEDIIGKMTALKTIGVNFSLDDFGTGYSSLSYLKRLPLDQLKIDQSFVRDILVDTNDAAISKTIVALAQSLGLSVIAEGVETAEQRDFLANSGCHAYQGYFFSRPLPLNDFEVYAKRIEAK
jgi:diguanylate cyclase (GGDEF)-like protein/PAS domain S-box-containing protein